MISFVQPTFTWTTDNKTPKVENMGEGLLRVSGALLQNCASADNPMDAILAAWCPEFTFTFLGYNSATEEVVFLVNPKRDLRSKSRNSLKGMLSLIATAVKSAEKDLKELE